MGWCGVEVTNVARCCGLRVGNCIGVRNRIEAKGFGVLINWECGLKVGRGFGNWVEWLELQI